MYVTKLMFGAPRTLHSDQPSLAIGMEMFQAPFQERVRRADNVSHRHTGTEQMWTDLDRIKVLVDCRLPAVAGRIHVGDVVAGHIDADLLGGNSLFRRVEYHFDSGHIYTSR